MDDVSTASERRRGMGTVGRAVEQIPGRHGRGAEKARARARLRNGKRMQEWGVPRSSSLFNPERTMSISLQRCADVLSEQRLRHHVDREQQVIRLVFVTRSYHNLRGERLLIAQLTTPDEGRRCRIAVERAFAVGPSPEQTCLKLCSAAAETPLVGVEFDADVENVRLVTELVVEDGAVTKRQLLAMLDAVVGAAECWQASLSDGSRSGGHADARRPNRQRAA